MLSLRFDINKVRITEFGVGRDVDGGQTFATLPVDANVKSALGEMVQATWDAMHKEEDGPKRYEPSERYGSTEYRYVPIEDNLAASVRNLHSAANLGIDVNALADSDCVFCYFARLIDSDGRRLTALRRATQFKGVLRKRLIHIVTDSLRLIDDRVFKLDNDFDLLVDSDNVHILRPSSFEFIGKLQQAILDAVPQNIRAIRADLPFVEFAGIEEYASQHSRAARYLASIRGQKEAENIDEAALKRHCARTGVDIGESGGRIAVSASHVMGFLEVLDRRRYELELVDGQPERFKAGSRTPIKH